MKPIRIAVDAMSGDHGMQVTMPAVFDILKAEPSVTVHLVGLESELHASLQSFPSALRKRCTVVPASQIVAMDEEPKHALRKKKDSSMRVAINLVKQDVVHACVSAGNTGALMATAKFVLGTVARISRPAILAQLPTVFGCPDVRVLDLGANAGATVEQLVEFAEMGHILLQSAYDIEQPRIALLNIGEEAIKGNETIKAASERLSQLSHLNYIGYIEADKIFYGAADLVVCDGFTGNIALKATEGTAKLMIDAVKHSFSSSLWARFVSVLALPVFKRMKTIMDPAQYNGAAFLGLTKIVVKSHGGTNRLGFAQAIRAAIRQAKQNTPALISAELHRLMGEQHEA